MSSLPKNILDTIEACRYCPMCRQSCPSEFISYKESDTPRGRAIILQSVYKMGEEFNESRIQAVYNCFVCGSCTSWCAGAEAGHYDIPELMKFARRDIVKRKMALEAVEAMKRSLIENNNQYGIPKSKSFTAKVKETKAEVLYLLGEEVNYRNHEIAEAMLKIFKHLKVKFTMLKDEPASGKILDILGYQDEARKKASAMAAGIKATGCKTVVVSDPLAFDAFRNYYSVWGVTLDPGLKILHVSEYLAGLIKSGDLKPRKTKTKVTLADSEFLGRFNNIYEAPREVIKACAGSQFAELKWNRGYLLATGEAALSFNDNIFDRGKELGSKIAVLINDIRAGKVITLSARAKNNLSGFEGFSALDIAEYVAGLL